jgi:glycosyltransferase involved in cell wall biosynthesis
LSEAIAYTLALCTHNHADRLVKTLSSLKNLKRPQAACEFLVIDNGSTDATADILKRADWHPSEFPVRIVHENKLGLSNARNRAIAEARGEYLIFLDDDETPHADWLLEYERAIRAWAPDALGGRIEVLFEGGERPAWLQDELLGFIGQLSHGQEPRELIDPSSPIFGGNFGFRTAVFTQIGGFDADLGRRGGDNTGGEDTEIYRRLIAAGKRVRWIPSAVIYHRIDSPKLRKGYFLDLHYRQGRMEGRRKRGLGSRVPPLYLFGHFGRALQRALVCRYSQGADYSLRLEMNAAYFLGFIHGWIFGQT